jgi:hypothetical protein
MGTSLRLACHPNESASCVSCCVGNKFLLARRQLAPAHRAAPLRVLPRLDDVLAHAHLEAPAAPRAAAAPAGGLPPPFVRDARTKKQSDAHAPE